MAPSSLQLLPTSSSSSSIPAKITGYNTNYRPIIWTTNKLPMTSSVAGAKKVRRQLTSTTSTTTTTAAATTVLRCSAASTSSRSTAAPNSTTSTAVLIEAESGDSSSVHVDHQIIDDNIRMNSETTNNMFQHHRDHEEEGEEEGGEEGEEEEEEEEGEDPRALRDIWKEIQGSNDWEGLLDPFNSHLRREILRYGEFAQACYDSFDFDPESKYCGSCKYLTSEFFSKMDHMSHYGYHMCRYLYATSNINLPNFFQKNSSMRSIWSPHANWMGYVAVTADESEIRRLGRRDIVIAWRGTVTYLEWIHDLKNILRPAHFRDTPFDVQIESGFYDLYTSKEEQRKCHYCCYSAREQVLAEVRRLVDKFKGDQEELSITVTGHSLGAALATLTAYDIAEMGINQVDIIGSKNYKKKKKKIPITVYSFASPRVGNLKFKERCEELGVKVLRIVNVHDKVPTVPGLIANENNQYQKYLEDKMHFPWSYAHVGTKLALDHKHSPFLRNTNDPSCAHNLEALLHLVDGYNSKYIKDLQSTKYDFKLATGRDVALVNKDSNFLKDECEVPPFWRQDHNKGMVRNTQGRWVVPKRPRVELHPPDIDYHLSLVLEDRDVLPPPHQSVI